MSKTTKLSIMMFLQYAIWGAWLPLFWPFLSHHRGLEDAPDRATLFSIGAVGALFAPFIAGQIADRWFNTEKFLAISHMIGAVLVWQLADRRHLRRSLLAFSILYSLVYAPTLPLTNSLAFHHLRRPRPRLRQGARVGHDRLDRRRHRHRRSGSRTTTAATAPSIRRHGRLRCG